MFGSCLTCVFIKSVGLPHILHNYALYGGAIGTQGTLSPYSSQMYVLNARPASRIMHHVRMNHQFA